MSERDRRVLATTSIAEFDDLRRLVSSTVGALNGTWALALDAFQAERERIVAAQVAELPLGALSEATEGRLRIRALEAAGYRSVLSVLKATSSQLQRVPGVGEHTSRQAIAAARELRRALLSSTRVRFDVDGRPDTQTSLLYRLHVHESTRHHLDGLLHWEERLTSAVPSVTDAQFETLGRWQRWRGGAAKKAVGAEALARLTAFLSDEAVPALRTSVAAIQMLLSGQAGPSRDELWRDFLSRPVHFNGLLIELGNPEAGPGAVQGFLPEDIVDRIEEFKLDSALLDVSLRGYQAFGAKFSLVQQRTIIGDEMGLGKTIEALAAICHLKAYGANHFLVICPTSVMANWEREVSRHTHLGHAHRLHGPDREVVLRRWRKLGGVAVTTFGTVSRLPLPDSPVDVVVVDEAHYTKNPYAQRTRAVRTWLSQADHALLLSGTPMENRVDEFRALVAHLNPELAEAIPRTAGLAGADAFRERVAPIYLRRNQEDVLAELPPKIETAEWLPLEGAAAVAYRQAVAGRNFMAMRQAAFQTDHPMDSPKMTRLHEVVEEAIANGQKIVVFSFFLDVLRRIHESLDRRSAGMLTGKVASSQRQVLIDQFEASPTPQVLVSQIEAGGVGLNIQAASVVILTEPQWKPSTEEQAIARCHRMGQVRPVSVHRLLTTESVDERMVEILARKSALFAEYVRASALKDATPAAVDITSLDETEDLASRAEQERRIIDLERRRLGIDE